MRVALIAAVTCLALAFAPDASFAAAKKKSIAGAKCSPGGAACSVDCGVSGWCNRMVCTNAGKWEKRITDCWGPACPAKC